MILTIIALEQILKWSISFCNWCVYSAATVWNVVIKLLGMFHSCTHEVIEKRLYLYFHVCVIVLYVC